ncbi:putative bifunctional UDP-N-acetylglucosamine transferase and deubiquitinase ALG13 isoform X5 [Takifugu rubripes]|uniref:putative bifunctional UDP-N-acetylglucosamine transferase and deubiquitinase ALG13 isoform X5 n=1 Tax=Takifugu rubripes TaxID=31033 RepID=UPI001145B02F|nr:putative bifunctional UDP-N-acetylglucosamine transferase and deubiquitinase ALG13 isoform X5 [Takifugu rubripes]
MVRRRIDGVIICVHFCGGMQKGLKKYFANMDEYLCSLGLYRKMVARDASSLFRAVSEQLYYSQNYHQKIRQDCANFMRANRCNFEPFVEGSFEKYLERLEDPKETVGQVEIKALSQLYRRCFQIYRYPGKSATVITEADFVDKVTLCCSINGHYDIVYPKSYPMSAAHCQSLLYELLYTKVFGLAEVELCQAMEAFRVGGRRYRNSLSVCSDIDVGYDTPEDRNQSREESEVGGASEEKLSVSDDAKPPSEAPPLSRLSLPYKVMKSLDRDVYRNLEFDVWQDNCKEMQKAEYMVFAGRQYFLGDKCQVRLEPKGKYYNAFIQEVGAQTSAVTVFIEELGEKHLVPLTDLKPVNPVPAWNIAAPARKGELDLDSRGQRHRHRYFRKSRGSSGVKGAELLIAPPSSYGTPATSGLPPRFQAAAPRPPPPPTPAAISYDPYVSPHRQAPPTARPRYGAARSSARFLNRHLIGPQLTYYNPGRRYCQDYDNYTFRSRRRQLAALNKECQFSFPVGEPGDLDPAMAYYQLDDGGDAVFSSLTSPAVPPSPTMRAPPGTSSSTYQVQRGPGPLPSSLPPGNTPVCSSEEELENCTVEDHAEFTDYIYASQDQTHSTSGVYSSADPTANQDEQEGETSDSPARPGLNYCYTQQVKPLAVICSSPSSSSSSPSSPSSRVTAAAHLPASTHTQSRPVAMMIPAASPWLVNELGEALCSVVAPPPYSYDPNGSDLPRDCRVLQYYFNLGVQWYHQSYWQQQAYATNSAEGPFQHYVPCLSQESPSHVAPPLYTETARGPHPPTSPYPESTRSMDVQTDGPGASGPTPSMEGPLISPTNPGSSVLYQDSLAPPQLLHLPYETPLPPTYLSAAPPLPSHTIHSPHLSHHPSYYACVPPSAHWGTLPAGSQAPRLYCPTPNPTHIVGYFTTPSPHHTTTHYIPPTI